MALRVVEKEWAVERVPINREGGFPMSEAGFTVGEVERAYPLCEHHPWRASPPNKA